MGDGGLGGGVGEGGQRVDTQIQGKKKQRKRTNGSWRMFPSSHNGSHDLEVTLCLPKRLTPPQGFRQSPSQENSLLSPSPFKTQYSAKQYSTQQYYQCVYGCLPLLSHRLQHRRVDGGVHSIPGCFPTALSHRGKLQQKVRVTSIHCSY